jgi:hypothetical protein
MILTVFESCEVSEGMTSTNKTMQYPCIGKIKNLRVVRYKVKSKDLHEALEEYEQFDSNKLISSEDYFDGECDDSRIVMAYLKGGY